MKSSAEREQHAERKREAREHAERIITINERYDAPAYSLRCWNELEAELRAKKEIIDQVRLICLRHNNPSVNLSVHRVVNTILQRIGKE